MAITKQCSFCNKAFTHYPYRNPIYCSVACYIQTRWGNGECRFCEKKCKYTYCSSICRKKYWNKNSYRLHTKKWYWTKKISLMKELGGKCKDCGETDFIVLDIDHIDKDKKNMFKNHQYTNTRRLKEWLENKGNLQLLCANCHRRKTHKQMGYAMAEFLEPKYVEIIKKRLNE